MKRKITYGLIAAFILLDVFIIYHFVDNYQQKKSITQRIEYLPNFNLEKLNGEVFTAKELKKHRWKVFVFFNSECHYCQSEAEQINVLEIIPDNIEFIWVSSEAHETLTAFQKKYKLGEILFLHDPYHQHAKSWGISTIPQFLIYSPEGKLFNNHKGALKIENIISQINEQTN